MALISQSTIAHFDRCKRRWWLGDYRQLSLPEEYRSPLYLGQLVHGALEQYYEATYGPERSIPEDPVAWIRDTAVAKIEANPDWAERIAKDAELAGIMVDGYMHWLSETGADADFALVEPEREIRARLVDDIELIGKLDGRVHTVDGWTGFLEHKTVGNFTDLPSYAQINRQLLTYGLLELLEYLEDPSVDAEGWRSDGAILNMLRKVKRTASAHPPFYERHRVSHNIEELRSHWRHTVAFAREIQAATARLDAGESHHIVAPPTPTSDCRWSCPFFSICPLLDDGSDVESVIEFEYVKHDPLERYAVG